MSETYKNDYSLTYDGFSAHFSDRESGFDIHIPRVSWAEIAFCRQSEPISVEQCIVEALNNPIGAAPIRTGARGKTAAIIVPDLTREFPTAKILPFVVAELEAAGVARDDIAVIVACGAHRAVTAEEKALILGERCLDLRLVSHDCCAGDLVYVGTTPYGTRLHVNSIAAKAGYRIVMGSVIPHEFAGFSGGRKYVLPGIASEEAILHNHRPEMLLSSKAAPGILEGNPVSEDMEAAAELFGIDFCISLVQNMDGSVAGVFCGALKSSHMAAVSHLRKFISVDVPPADLIVTTPGSPLDINLYQSMKALFALSPVLGPDSVVLLYSRCREGVGGDDMLKPFAYSEPDDIIAAALEDYVVVKDHALLLGRLYKETGVNVVFASPALEPGVLGNMFRFASQSIEEALDYALSLCPPNPRVLFFPKPQRTLPRPV